MTGFGRGEFLDAGHRVVAEIKAVNHRYNEIVIRMPKNLGSLEDKIRRQVSATLVRGRIDIFISIDEYGEKKRSVRVDKELAIAYHKAMRDLAELLQAPYTTDILHLSKYPDIIKAEEVTDDMESLWPKLSASIDIAIANLMQMRVTEGSNIEYDLLGRIDKLSSFMGKIEERTPQIIMEYREKLLTRMRDLLAAIDIQSDEVRLLQETALYADRINVTEEIVRFGSHVSQFRLTLSKEEAVGRKLDFIVQEINREINTIGSKSNDYYITNLVVEIKSEIEKIREQIQNIE